VNKSWSIEIRLGIISIHRKQERLKELGFTNENECFIFEDGEIDSWTNYACIRRNKRKKIECSLLDDGTWYIPCDGIW